MPGTSADHPFAVDVWTLEALTAERLRAIGEVLSDGGGERALVARFPRSGGGAGLILRGIRPARRMRWRF